MSIENGNIAELQFVLSATQRGLIVSRPTINATVYDFLVDNSKRILKVQVKSNFREPDQRGGGYGLNIQKGAGVYAPAEIDVIASYISTLNLWYFFPIKDLGEQKKISVFPYSMESKWNKYLQSWGVLLN